jgi:predicted nucleic acid-binding protein
LTEPLFFDTDCISAFLWVDNESILSKLFPGRIIIPKEVYDELSHPGVNRVKGLKAQIDLMLQAGDAAIETIMVGTDTYNLYRKLTVSPDPGHKIIGCGEAASISLAKEKHGILASNNLRDISAYVTEYGLFHLTTGDIMKMALDAGYIDEAQGNIIWANMIARRRKLGYATFSDYLANHQSSEPA